MIGLDLDVRGLKDITYYTELKGEFVFHKECASRTTATCLKKGESICKTSGVDIIRYRKGEFCCRPKMNLSDILEEGIATMSSQNSKALQGCYES